MCAVCVGLEHQPEPGSNARSILTGHGARQAVTLIIGCQIAAIDRRCSCQHADAKEVCEKRHSSTPCVCHFTRSSLGATGPFRCRCGPGIWQERAAIIRARWRRLGSPSSYAPVTAARPFAYGIKMIRLRQRKRRRAFFLRQTNFHDRMVNGS